MMTLLFFLAAAFSVFVAIKSAKEEQRRQEWRQRCRVNHLKA